MHSPIHDGDRPPVLTDEEAHALEVGYFKLRADLATLEAIHKHNIRQITADLTWTGITVSVVVLVGLANALTVRDEWLANTCVVVSSLVFVRALWNVTPWMRRRASERIQASYTRDPSKDLPRR